MLTAAAVATKLGISRRTRYRNMAYTWDYEFIPLKNGKPGKRLRLVTFYYTPINYCDLCGKFGPPKKVQIRNDVYGWNRENREDYTTKSKDMLCMGCWNKIRPIVNREREADKLQRLINQLQRTINHERKQGYQDNRGASRLSGDDDARRQER